MTAGQGDRGLGAELRRVRQSRGLSQRQAAALIGLTAHSSISQFESGQRVPQADIIAAYERVFSLPPGSLARLRSAALQDRADAVYQASTYSDAPASAVGKGIPRDGAGRRNVRYKLVATGAILVGLLLATGTAGGAPTVDPTWAALTQNVTNHGEPNAAPEPMDGDDPRARDCAADAVTRAEVPLYLADGTQFGMLRLRHSNRCGTNWASALYANPKLYTIWLAAIRPSDGAEVQFDWSNNTPPGSYGDMLSTGSGCVLVEGTVRTPTGTGPLARTTCMK